MTGQGGETPRCVICDIASGELETPGGHLLQTTHWIVTHHHSDRGLYPGRLMVALRRHCASFADLSPDESGEFGAVVKRCTAALEAELAPARVYLASFNEGSAHVHAHLLIRHKDEETRGPALLSKRMRDEVCDRETATAMAERLAARLS